MSYSTLFGEGSLAEDNDLEALWKLQETSGLIVIDSSSNSNNGTINDTPLLGQTGPKIWLPNSYKFNNSGQKYNVDVGLDFSGDFTLSFFTRVPTSDVYNQLAEYVGNTFDQILEIRKVNFASTIQVGYKAGSAGTITVVSADDVTDTADFVHLAIIKNQDDIQIYVNNVASGSSGSYTATSFASNQFDYFIGCRGWASNDRGWNGFVAHHSHFSKALSVSELEEIDDGPEPEVITIPNLSGTPEIGNVLSVTTGTWDNKSNGSVTLTYQWYRNDNAVGLNETLISGATSTTYLLVSADEDKYIRCKVSPSNNGGNEPLFDAYSNMSSQISGGGSGQTVNLELISETNSVNNLTVQIDQSIELIPIVETNTLNSLNIQQDQSLVLNKIDETNSIYSLNIGIDQTINLGIVTENNTLNSLTVQKDQTIELGINNEINTVYSLNVSNGNTQNISLSKINETNVVNSLIVDNPRTYVLGQNTENNTIFDLSVNQDQTVVLNKITEVNSVYGLNVLQANIVQLDRIIENTTLNNLTVIKPQTIQLARLTETNTVNSLTVYKPGTGSFNPLRMMIG